MDFVIGGDCSNENISLTDASVQFADTIVSRTWYLDDATIGNGINAFSAPLTAGNHLVSLEATTADGCVTRTDSVLNILQSVTSSFTFPKDFGVPGDAITFTDGSSGASSTQWLLNGVVVNSDNAQESIVFSDAATHVVSLVANNDEGCSDTTSHEVLIAVPEGDLSISQLELVENGTIGSIILEIQNDGNIPVDNTRVRVELENQFSITEQVEELIGVGDSRLVGLNVGIPLTSSDLTFLCITLESQYEGFEDSDLDNNEECVTLEPRIVVESPAPNPVRDFTSIDVVLPQAGEIVWAIVDASGKVEQEETVNANEGLNRIPLDLRSLNVGTYFVRVSVGGNILYKRVIRI